MLHASGIEPVGVADEMLNDMPGADADPIWQRREPSDGDRGLIRVLGQVDHRLVSFELPLSAVGSWPGPATEPRRLIVG